MRVDNRARAEDERDLMVAIRLQHLHLALQAVGREDVVLRQQLEVAARRFRQASIPVALWTEVLRVAETSDTGIPETGRDRGGVIRRGVVDDQHFEIRKRLSENGVDGLPDMGGAPVCRDADRDHRLGAWCVHHRAD